ncbi:MAG: DUF2085 domain-containing protein [Anaerolineae bacterium]|nr:DUF2085 domain-containing protein [Anaerolineae bacterium]MDW8070561.1 DUF2085 domain-containing protein [Anaerolineae bacterium]
MDNCAAEKIIASLGTHFPLSWLRFHLRWIAWLIPLGVIGAFLLLSPGDVLTKTRLIGYAVCHQLPERSFHLAGEQLPLCARCSGTFLGALSGFVLLTLRGRQRAIGLPPTPILVVLVTFIIALGIDGLNSYLTFFPSLPHLYQPHNWLRLTTGTFNGLALSAIIYPVLNYSLWRDVVNTPSVKDFKELGLLIVTGTGIVFVVLLQPAPLLLPLAVLSTLGVLTVLTALNTILLLMVLNCYGRIVKWQQALLPLWTGLAVSFIELGAIDLLRYLVTRGAGLPF